MPAMTHPLIIAGEERAGGSGRYQVRNPWDDREVGTVELADAKTVEQAVLAAQEGFRLSRKLSAYERADALEAVADGLQSERESLAQLITAETGKPIQFSRIEVDRAVFTFEVAAEEAKRIGGEVLPLDLASASAGRFGITRRFPLGIILCISPFNFPLNLVAHKVAPAMAAGNAFILKPAPQAPLTALRLGTIIAQSGYPRSAVNVLAATNEVASNLVADERIAMLSFTGSAQVGWHLKSISGRKKILLELGGNAGVIVDRDVPVAETARKNAFGAFVSAGQVCIKVQRIYIHEAIFEEYLREFVSAATEMKCGDPSDANTVVGPLIDDGAAKRMLEWISEAAAGGATVHCGGRREGKIIHPTVLTNAPGSCKAVTDEIFGPVATLHPFREFADAIAGVNGSRYGLQAGIFSNNFKHILASFNEIEVGAVVINDNPTYRIDHMPYGGMKQSGFGREGIRYAVEAMTEPKLMVIAP